MTDAKNETDSTAEATPAEATPAETTPAETTPAETTAGTDDEMRRRYREALERKRGSGPGSGNSHGGPKSSAPASNDKTQRVFRRKSGG